MCATQMGVVVMRKGRVAAHVLVGLSLVLAACGGDDDATTDDDGTQQTDDDGDEPADDGGDDGGDDDGGDEPADGGGDEPADDGGDDNGGSDDGGDDGTAGDGDAAGEEDPDAVLRYGESRLTSLDPHQARTLYDNTYLYPVFDRLVHYDSQGNVEPGLATSWEFVDDGAALVLELREGVVFHDGTPMDAEAVKASLDRARTFEGSQVANELAVIETIDVVDPLTVRLNLNGPAAPLPLILADRAGMIMSTASLSDPNVDVTPVGTGMYSFVEYRPDEIVVYERNPDYWAPEDAKLGGMEIVIIPDDAARLNAFRTGQLDATWVDESAVESLQGEGFAVDVISRLGLYHVQLNRSMPPFDNENVRLAMSHAIDREAITEGVLFGLAEPQLQAMPEGNPGHNPELTLDYLPYDPDRARELIAESGLDNISFECVVVNTSGYIARTEAIQAMLAEVGIDMQIRIIDATEIIPIFYVDQDAPCASTPFGGRLDPSQTIGLMFTSTGFLNPGGGTTERIEELHAEALAELDQDRRVELFQEFSQIYVDEALNISIHVMSFPLAHTERLTGVDQLFDIRPFDVRGVGLTAE